MRKSGMALAVTICTLAGFLNAYSGFTLRMVVPDTYQSKMQSVIERIENIYQESQTQTNRTLILRKTGSSQTLEIIDQEYIINAWYNDSRMLVTFDYDLDALLAMELFIDMFEGNESTEDFSQDAKNFPIESMIYQGWNGSDWENDFRLITKTNTDGFASEIEIQGWINNDWVSQSKTTFIYDGNKNLTGSVILLDVGGLGTLENMVKFEYIYDGNGFKIQEKQYAWLQGAWSLFSQIDITNNGSGYPIVEVTQMGAMGFMMNSLRAEKEYDSKFNIISRINQLWDLFTQDWMNSNRELYEYNANSDWTVYRYQTWGTANWVDSTRETKTYSGQNLTKWLLESWSGTQWNNEEQSTIEYNGNNFPTKETDQVWESGGWLNDELTTFTYGPNNIPTEILIQNWEGGQWVNYERSLISPSTNVEELPIQPTDYMLTNYPNPFNPSTTIIFTLPRPSVVNFKVMDLQGRLIKIITTGETFQAGTHSVLWDGTNDQGRKVASGLYLYRLESGNYTMTQRCILIK